MKKIVGFMLAALMVVGLMGGVAMAQDEELMQDFVNLEKVYIPPLFFTNQGPDYIAPAQMTMNKLIKEWNAFYTKYYDYKPDYANWQSYFDAIDTAIKDAATKIDGTPAAHEVLEAVRATMLDLRPKNGFPKFITDKMTIYHDPMEHIVLTLKNATAPTPELMAELALTLEETQKAWSDVEKCPVDAGLWGFSVQQMNMYYNMLQAERDALDAFAAAFAAGNFPLMKQTGTLALKGPFVQAYKFFGAFPTMQ
ncbi:MAG: hypothetical protein RQ754_05890 [Desulfuromonadales bacterium]|nr:hypothetical protein [Desulfuromonadales bacterium]